MERVRMAFNDAELLALNLDVARREEAGESVTAPACRPAIPTPPASSPTIASGRLDHVSLPHLTLLPGRRR